MSLKETQGSICIIAEKQCESNMANIHFGCTLWQQPKTLSLWIIPGIFPCHTTELNKKLWITFFLSVDLQVVVMFSCLIVFPEQKLCILVCLFLNPFSENNMLKYS